MPFRHTGLDLPVDGSYVTTETIILTPTSRDYVTISSSSPEDPPVIDCNFNATEADRYILREGLRNTVRVMRDTKSAQSFIEDDVVPEGHGRLLADSLDESFNNRIRDFGFSLDHPAGSCAMGKVVDSKCKVTGVENLRVVDASIFPVPISAHPRGCIYALAEKAAEMIAQAYTNFIPLLCSQTVDSKSVCLSIYHSAVPSRNSLCAEKSLGVRLNRGIKIYPLYRIASCFLIPMIKVCTPSSTLQST